MSLTEKFGTLVDELCLVTPPDRDTSRTEIATLLHFGGGLSVTAGMVRLESEPITGAAGAYRLTKLLRHRYNIQAPVLTDVMGHRGPVVRISSGEVTTLAAKVGLLTRLGAPVVGLPPRVVTEGAASPAVAAAALRGAVLAAGGLNRSARGVLSLTVRCPGLAAAVALRAMARHLGASAVLRESSTGHHSVHRLLLRDRGGLAVVLQAMGAAQFSYDNIDPEAEIRRSEQTRPLHSSNRDRVTRAAAASTARVRAAMEVLGDDLPPTLAVVAMARLEHPEASMAQLGQMCYPPLTKNAVASRLRRLRELASAGSTVRLLA